MNEIGTEQLQSTAQIAEGRGKEGRRERGLHSRRQPAAVFPDPNPEPADHSGTAPHQVNSLA